MIKLGADELLYPLNVDRDGCLKPADILAAAGDHVGACSDLQHAADLQELDQPVRDGSGG
jgi:hypothetical protein